MKKTLVPVLAALLAAPPVLADTLTSMLKKGPLARVDYDQRGKFKGSTVVIDIDAPVQVVWDTLADFRSYPRFMPRCEEVEVKEKDGYHFVEFDIDTPIVSTNYTSRYKMDAQKRRADILIVEGDVEGSTFTWQLETVPRGTRVTYWGNIKNFSSVVSSLDDKDQTITIGVNVVSFIAAARSLKTESEKRARALADKAGPADPNPAISAPPASR